MVSHVRHCVDLKKSKSIYQPIFESQLFFCCADFDKKFQNPFKHFPITFATWFQLSFDSYYYTSWFKHGYLNISPQRIRTYGRYSIINETDCQYNLQFESILFYDLYIYIYVHIYTYKFKQRLDRVISANLFQPSVTCHIETTQLTFTYSRVNNRNTRKMCRICSKLT